MMKVTSIGYVKIKYDKLAQILAEIDFLKHRKERIFQASNKLLEDNTKAGQTIKDLEGNMQLLELRLKEVMENAETNHRLQHEYRERIDNILRYCNKVVKVSKKAKIELDRIAYSEDDKGNPFYPDTTN